MKDTVPTSIGLAQNTVFGPLYYPAVGAGVALAGRKVDPASKFCLHSWEVQRLHFAAGLSTDLDGGVVFQTDSQDPPEEGEAEEPCGVGVLKAALLVSAAKGAVHSVEAAPPGAGDAFCQAGAAEARRAAAGAAPARAAPAGAAPAGAAPAGAARAGAIPAGGPAVYEKSAPA